MLVCSGRIVLGVETETLRCMVTSRAERYLFLDMAQVRALDAAGLGLLVDLQSWTQQRNCMMAIMNPSPQVRKLIALTNLHSVLQVAGPAADGVPHPCDSDADSQQAMTA